MTKPPSILESDRSTGGAAHQLSQTANLSLSPSIRIAANAAIAGLWLWLYWPVFDYLAIIFSREDFRANQLALVGIVVLIATRVRKGDLHPQIDAEPHLFSPALALALGGSVLYLAVERFLDINTLSASLFGLASYGLLGLWMQPRRWQQGLPAALLIVGTLPFGEHMQTFVGYPMRTLTAAIVRDGLAAAGVASIGIDTILVFENGVSQVDLPCSGVKSLWTGMLFLIAATWIERRRLNLRWFLTGVAFAGLLFAANVARVGALVVVGQVAGWQLAAEMLHIPLGVLGFAAACAAAVALLRLQRPASSQFSEDFYAGAPRVASSALKRPIWLAPVMAVAILAMVLIYSPRPQTGLAQPPPAWEFPPGLVAVPEPLKPDEIEWLTRGGAESADRRRFEWRGNDSSTAGSVPDPTTGPVTGSMIFITSTTWRAQHRPERCFEVYGLSLDHSHTYLVAPDFPVRLVSLSYGDNRNQLSATYWFQSADRATDDYATRMWADLAPRRDRWVLVTVLFDRVHDPHSESMEAFHIALRDTIARSLGEG